MEARASPGVYAVWGETEVPEAPRAARPLGVFSPKTVRPEASPSLRRRPKRPKAQVSRGLGLHDIIYTKTKVRAALFAIAKTLAPMTVRFFFHFLLLRRDLRIAAAGDHVPSERSAAALRALGIVPLALVWGKGASGAEPDPASAASATISTISVSADVTCVSGG